MQTTRFQCTNTYDNVAYSLAHRFSSISCFLSLMLNLILQGVEGALVVVLECFYSVDQDKKCLRRRDHPYKLGIELNNLP